ncbi:hypothetical protein [Stenotrophomonas sp. CC22-02]|uniref:hypothetical protein n=1 Tax=Stenotrophomonas sp. CC22-02 TaxID=1378087 RepID=UPI00106311AC|nr:hypothetical protein [Stenotrophomonas sp. CC22-02]TDV30798.1 hypothetical protein N440_1637 [Stenotrophomonas sp. CC22-02]
MLPKRQVVPLDQVPAALEKTGFILEHVVASAFKKARWTTIGSRYYADDVDGRARELDLIAYRTVTNGDLEVVSAVLASCKKDEARTWAFLTEEKPRQDPNYDWNPVHFWTDVEPLRTYLKTEDWRKELYGALGGTYEGLFAATKSVFAFQQLGVTQQNQGKRKGGASHDAAVPRPVVTAPVTSQNDDQIFGSIVSVMKALDHEMESLPNRAKNKKRLYHFTLLSIVDAPLVDVFYKGNSPTVTEIDGITHLSRYMVNRRELSALVHFVQASALPQYLKCLTESTAPSAKFFTELVGRSYEAIISNVHVRSYFSKAMNGMLVWRINEALRRLTGVYGEVSSVELGYKDDFLEIELDEDRFTIDLLNQDAELSESVKELLNKRARYQGRFRFALDIPF